MSDDSAYATDFPHPARQGRLAGTGLKAAIMVSRYNTKITSQLLTGAKQALVEKDVTVTDDDIYLVPGALELPVLARRLVKSERYDFLVALGTVIKGETAHFEQVCQESSAGLMQVCLKSGIPIGFGILTTYNEAQALERTGGAKGNKGAEAALSALEMANLLRTIKKKD